MESAQKSVEEASSKIDQLSELEVQLRSEIAKQTEEQQRLKEQIEKEGAQATKEIENLKEKLAASQKAAAEGASAEYLIATHKADYVSLQGSFDQLKEDFKNSETQNQGLESELQNTTKALGSAQEKFGKTLSGY